MWKAIYVMDSDGTIDEYPLKENGKHERRMTRQKRRDLSQVPGDVEPPQLHQMAPQPGMMAPVMPAIYPTFGVPVPAQIPLVCERPQQVPLCYPSGHGSVEFGKFPGLSRGKETNNLVIPPLYEPKTKPKSDHIGGAKGGSDQGKDARDKGPLPTSIDMLLNK